MDKRDQILAKLAVRLGLIEAAMLRRATQLLAQFPGRSLDRILLDTGFIDAARHQRLVQAFNDELRRAQRAAESPPPPRRTDLASRGLSDSDLLLETYRPPPTRKGSSRTTAKIQVPHATPEGAGSSSDLELDVPDDVDVPEDIFAQPTIVIPDEEPEPPLILREVDDDGPLLLGEDSDDGIDVYREATTILREEGDVFAQPTEVLPEGQEDIYVQPTIVLKDEAAADIYAQPTAVLEDGDDAQPLRLVDDSSEQQRLASEPQGVGMESSAELEGLDVRLKRDVEAKSTGPILVPGVRSKKGQGALSSKEFQRRLKMRQDFAGFTIGDYKILGEISRGAFGVVLEAEPGGVTKSLAKDRGYEGTLALKVSLENESDPRTTERFIEETRVQIGFDHPHIVRIFDCGVERGLTYYSMELIHGIEARSHVLKNGPMPPLLAVRVVKEVASALAYVHQQRIYHRDLKPHNILLDTNTKPYRAVLIDFGLVTEHESQHDKGLILGTPSYMPPEQAQPRGGHGPINSTSDTYSLGATLYFLLTGRAPFTDKDPRKIIKMVLEEPARDPAELNQQIPRRIADICLKCLEKRQRDRYHSAKQLEADLERELKSGQMMLKAKSFLGRFLGKRK